MHGQEEDSSEKNRVEEHPVIVKGWYDPHQQPDQRLLAQSGMKLAGIAGSAHDSDLPDRSYHTINERTCCYKFLDSVCLDTL